MTEKLATLPTNCPALRDAFETISAIAVEAVWLPNQAKAITLGQAQTALRDLHHRLPRFQDLRVFEAAVTAYLSTLRSSMQDGDTPLCDTTRARLAQAVELLELVRSQSRTLANVQPGGMVRLGNQAERARFEAWAQAQSYRGGNIMADRDAVHPDVYADPIAQLTWKSWQTALSAQPSPDGQEDVLPALPYPNYPVSKTGLQNNAYTASQMQNYARAALAARQPVGEPVGTVHSGKYASGMPWCEVEWHIPQPAGTKLYAAPIAQAVDLSPSQSVLAEVAQERARQEAKWGQQNHVDWTPTLAATDLAGAWPAGVGDHFKFITDYKAKGAEGHRLGYFDILMEEVAEAHDEARDGDTKATRAELVQVAAVAVAWIECIDRRLALTDSQAEVSRG
ncbi:hypothetical protein [Stenotrophomonas maltophilia]|uniref:hypothetical protein n=1 Tax=Stenotrophomonas maltophilia TaxID=40324 RepID=UPI001F0CE15B|nr:hypothetical protein [Stenotrophomonas maltophilia]